jgi:hypothetical protein
MNGSKAVSRAWSDNEMPQHLCGGPDVRGGEGGGVTTSGIDKVGDASVMAEDEATAAATGLVEKGCIRRGKITVTGRADTAAAAAAAAAVDETKEADNELVVVARDGEAATSIAPGGPMPTSSCMATG